MIYEWKTNWFKTDANVAGKVFDELDKSVGLTAKTLVDASRDDSAPLHDEFEWDDVVAGEKYREQQARVMIQNLVVRVNEDPDVAPTRAYVIVENTSSLYENIVVVLNDEDKAQKLLKSAMQELQSFERKYSELEALAGVFREIRKIRESA